jgi:hypothetical protein
VDSECVLLTRLDFSLELVWTYRCLQASGDIIYVVCGMYLSSCARSCYDGLIMVISVFLECLGICRSVESLGEGCV